MFAIAGVVAFAISYALYKDPEPAAAADKPVVQASVSAPATDAESAATLSAAAADAAVAAVAGAAPAVRAEVLLAPMAGTAIKMTDVPRPRLRERGHGHRRRRAAHRGQALRARRGHRDRARRDRPTPLGMTTDAGAEVLMHIGHRHRDP